VVRIEAWMASVALLTTLALVSLSATHSRPANESKLQAGQAEMGRGNFDAALRDLDAALLEAPDPQTLVRIHLLRAQAYGAKQDYVQAEGALASALEFDPEASLDPAKVDPSLVKTLESLRQRLTGELHISADQSGARVKLDGNELGPVPIKTEVPIGRHTLEAATPDGKFAVRQQVVVRRSGTHVQLLLIATEAAPVATGTPTVSTTPVARLDRSIIPFAELRFDLDLTSLFQMERGNTVIGSIGNNLDPSFGEMVGGGIRSRFFKASAAIRFRPWWGFHLRGALSIPLTDRLDGYVSVEVLGDFIQATLEMGLGASVGIEYLWGDWLGIFTELGARHFFSYPEDDVVLQGGLRIWFP
jgi:hypothetical protein